MSQNICNICGANYEYVGGRWKCPACGAFKAEELSNEEVTLLYNAAQKLRLSDFDEAENAYTDILEKYPQNPYGYWGKLLSRYGIKYEEDFDGRKIPTCYAASIESVLNDKDYIKALSLADADTKAYFEQQAQYIERVRKEWIERARKEKPYDIFICYKDSDRANGIERTQDSIAAQDLYIHLTEQGYRVFFSRESLRDKVGEKYEPYIFNALSTAKVMLVYGTSSEYITSTWLKNEWTRYEKRLQAGEKKPNSLIVACDGFSPNELPKTLSSMQCFDATRRSFYTDLDTVLKRIIKAEEKPKFTNDNLKKEPIKQTSSAEVPKKKVTTPPKVADKKTLPKKAKIATIVVTIIAVIGVLGLLGQLGNDGNVDSLTDSKYGVTITAQDKIFDGNSKITVGKTTDGVEHRSWVNAVNNAKGIELQNAIVYDISCDVNITENVTVKVPYSKASANTEVKVFYVSDNKTTIEEHSCSYANSFVEFETNHFSHYVIGEVEKSASGSGSEQTKEPNAPTLEYGILQVGVCADYPPYEYMESGEYKGIEIDIIEAIAVELGLEVRFENDSFEDLLTNLTNKSVDCIIGVTETEERNELASPSYTMFAEDDYEYIIYFDKSATDLKTKVNETINKLRTDGTINTIYKQYTVKSGSVKVIFDPNGGEGTRIIEFAEKNTSITMKDTVFTRPGYTFLGWGKYPGGEAIYKVGTYYEVGSDSEYVIYAIWRKNKNTIVFNANGGVGEMESDTVETGSGAWLPTSTFTREGYTFLGWSEDPSSSVPEYEAYETYWVGAEPQYTLYALWSANENSIVFNANGGSGSMTPQKIKTGATANLSACTFERDGYKFMGWSTTSDGEVEYQDEASYTMGTNTSYTLYAVWSGGYIRDGDYIYFGEYPQTLKANNVSITATQDSRGYYLGSDGYYYAKVVANLNDTRHNSFSNGTLATNGTTYYFKVEPIRWRILSTDGETALILCDSIIANQAYDAGGSDNYKNSDIRAWLNETFYQTAFSELQREIILITTVDNSSSSTGGSSFSSEPNLSACEDTDDKIFLLSYKEVTNSAYGFSSSDSTFDTVRKMQTSDYSIATGVDMFAGYGSWWLRSPRGYNYSNLAKYVTESGNIYEGENVSDDSHGVVPALQIRL